MENREDILLPPDPARVMEGLRDTGYSFNTAIADIIDNSIAAGAKNIDILIDLEKRDPRSKLEEPFVWIADDGCGMDLNELQNAMRYGSEEREDLSSLGKFGLGLKTASTAYCRKLSVASIGKDKTLRKVQWDLDYIARTKKWKLKQEVASADERTFLKGLIGHGTGTLVIWENIDKLGKNGKFPSASSMNKIRNKLASHLSMVFQRYLDPLNTDVPTVHIFLNEKELKPWDPFCLKEPETECLYSQALGIGEEGADESEEALLQVRCYMIPRKGDYSSKAAEEEANVSNDMQGFYIYRENRLIHYGDWMGMFTREPHESLLRVDLSFDYRLDSAFRVDIKKSRIELAEVVYDHIKKEILPGPRRAAQDRYRKGTSKHIARTTEETHKSSNQNLENKASSVEEAKVSVDPGTNQVQIKNKNGVFKHQLVIKSSEHPGQCRVVPTEGLENGVLWEPALVDEKHAILLNTHHPYYQKIYFPVKTNNNMIIGMDALLWSLSEAELATMNDLTKEQYEEMRINVSRFLKKLIADLPEPDTETKGKKK